MIGQMTDNITLINSCLYMAAYQSCGGHVLCHICVSHMLVTYLSLAYLAWFSHIVRISGFDCQIRRLWFGKIMNINNKTLWLKKCERKLRDR